MNTGIQYIRQWLHQSFQLFVILTYGWCRQCILSSSWWYCRRLRCAQEVRAYDTHCWIWHSAHTDMTRVWHTHTSTSPVYWLCQLLSLCNNSALVQYNTELFPSRPENIPLLQSYLRDKAHSWRSSAIKVHKNQISKLNWTEVLTKSHLSVFLTTDTACVSHFKPSSSLAVHLALVQLICMQRRYHSGTCTTRFKINFQLLTKQPNNNKK